MLKKYRMDLHQIPEIGFNEFKTSEYIYNHIKDMDCKITRVSTGFVLLFDNKAKHSIAFRTDMDGLPIKEETSLSFKSTNDCMHACGHDGHMAMMLGFCDYLNNHYKEYDKNIVIIFQPSEEIYGGALSIINSNLLNEYNVKAIFAYHIWPGLKKGIIYTRCNEMMAKSCEVDIIIKGKSAHAASASQGNDALRSGVEFAKEMYDFIDSMDVNIYKLFKIGKFESGTIRNVISDNTHLYATMRAYSDDVINLMSNKLKETAINIDNKYGVKTEIIIKDGGYPPVINNSLLVEKLLNKNNNVKLLKDPVMQAEDFGNYSKIIPSVFMFLGEESNIPLHNSKFDFNMDILEEGLKNYIKILSIEL